ncbi:Protein detoxification 40 [Vitis vinifera]|uniref:Protein detoxification 40 n=1 Tax=Vitis vinifera TaxID=29760 RepID=A0A438JG47_VITVI|nr:Protein detoxification 40 [Vitis vinifera]
MESTQDELAQPILLPKQYSSSPEPVSSELEEARQLLSTCSTTLHPCPRQIFCGHLGNLELAASALGNNGIQIFSYGLMVSAWDGKCSGDTVWTSLWCPQVDMLGVYLQRSTILLTATGIPLTIIYIFSKDLLLLLGESTEIASAAAIFVYPLCPPLTELAGHIQVGSGAVRGITDTGPDAGLLENAEIALDSLSICMTISGWVFMIAVGFNAAASVRVSNEIGAGHPKSASFAVFVVTSTSFIIAVFLAILVMLLRHVVSYVFTSGTTVADAVSDLAPFLAVSIVLNGIQPVLSGVAVGCGWQAFVAYVNVGCYYVVGIPLGALLGFKFDLGVKGIWSGMIGGTVMQTLILLWVTYRTDWNKEVEKAKSRLETWDTNNSASLD